MVDQQVGVPDLPEHVDLAVLLALQPRLGDRRPGRVTQLGVAGDVIDAFGAVSIACVYAMAQGALEHSDADVAVAISGVAGPDGGTEQKPVGTVVFARAVRDAEQREAESKLFDAGDRSEVRRQATLCALELLLP